MRTYTQPPRGWAKGVGVLAGLVLIVACSTDAAAQQRKYLVELGAAAAYQSFDSKALLASSAGGTGRIGVWLPLNFSLEVQADLSSSKSQSRDESVGVKTFAASALYNILVGSGSWVYLKAGAGTTRYGSSCRVDVATPGESICGRSGAFLGGAGFRVGITPTVLVRGEGLLTRNRSKGNPDAALPPHTIVNFGANLGLSVLLGSKPIP